MMSKVAEVEQMSQAIGYEPQDGRGHGWVAENNPGIPSLSQLEMASVAKVLGLSLEPLVGKGIRYNRWGAG
jgi:hypothetical protein